MTSSRGLLALLGAVAVGVGWLGCATSNGDPFEEGTEPAPSGTSTSKTDGGGTRPAFEAGFEDAPEPDPTPDGGDTCIDKDDPGSSETTAKVLPNTDDCDNSIKTVKGVANGAVDVDYYKLTAEDKGSITQFCSLDTIFESPTAGLELCVYVRCKNGTPTSVSGCTGGTQKTSTIGMPGCCASTPSQATPKWDCAGVTDDDSADFFISTKQLAGGDKCLPYELRYRF